MSQRRHGVIGKLLTVLLFTSILFATTIMAHPGSGIVVDRKGDVYFLDTGAGLWKIDSQGRLTQIPGPRFHWMTLDDDDRFSTVRLPSGARGDVVRAGSSPTLLLASDFPLAVGANGNLYYPNHVSGSGFQLLELTPAGRTTIFTNLTAAPGGRDLRWVNGLAAGADGSLYYSEDNAVRRIDVRGQVTTVIASPKIPTCVSIAGATRPYLRGLAVDGRGTIYVAASGCGSVIKIATNGRVTTVLQLQSPWTPTGVALFGKDVYVLEYLQTAASIEPENRRAWVPRVRKITADGRTRIIASISRRER